jgi:surface antigen
MSLRGRSETRVRRARAALAILSSLAVCSCSMSFPLPSLFGDDDEPTNSVQARIISPLSPELGAEDWRRAKGALAIALDPQGNGSSVTWDNPDTGMKGSFVPVGQPFVKSDEICRAFLAKLVLQSGIKPLQGTACRPSGGEWAIKDVKPWRKPV